MTITLGWWLLPGAITAVSIAPGAFFVMLGLDGGHHGDDMMTMGAAMMGVGAVVSLASWAVWWLL